MNPISYNEYARETLTRLSQGAFLTTKKDDQVNTMTIGWGAVSYMWGKPVFTVMVRESRYTKHMIDAAGEFTVSLPEGALADAVKLCGAKSGRDMDKIAEAGLTLLPPAKLSTPFIGGCSLHFECKTLYKQEMDLALLDEATRDRWYANGDVHTIYYGEIIGAYRA